MLTHHTALNNELLYKYNEFFFQLFIYYAHENQTYLLIFEGIFQINHACRLDSHIPSIFTVHIAYNYGIVHLVSSSIYNTT